MASEGYVGFGSSLTIGGTGAYQFRDWSGPSMSMSTADISNQGSTGGWKEYVAGMIDGGEFSFDEVLGSTGATGSIDFLVTTMAARTAQSVVVTAPNGNTLTFNGLITKVEPAAGLEDELAVDVSIKVTGPVTVG